ncbi:MAG: RagB/SusD family nutrient uptake outer membrane protein, partial [Bacteroidota bacterium]|nr:RagB/SusD family nutrient uptake outer membrane protein [Bacteroidota bacterium]
DVEYSRNVIQSRDWNPKMYLLPIILDEINRNGELVQNPLY